MKPRAQALGRRAFGLLHGLGFAGALSEVGLPHGDIPLALLSFNLGIEVGQLGIAALAIAVGWLWAQRIGTPPPVLRRLAVTAIGGLAGYWLLERGLRLLFPVL